MIRSDGLSNTVLFLKCFHNGDKPYVMHLCTMLIDT